MRKPSNSVTIHGYAIDRQRRDLPGSSPGNVRRAVMQGRITRSCAKHKSCPTTCKAGRIDPSRADREWEENRRAPGRPGRLASIPPRATEQQDPDTMTPRMARDYWDARRARLKFEREAGALVKVSEIQAHIFAKARQVREGLLPLARRLAGPLALESDPRQAELLLERAFREFLQGISWDTGAAVGQIQKRGSARRRKPAKSARKVVKSGRSPREG
jgi:hypothetical protein